MPFHSYRLIRLNKAIGQSDDVKTHSDYDITTYDNFGRRNDRVVKLSEVDRDWGKLRMNGDRFAKYCGGVCTPISEEEFDTLVSRYVK